MLDGSKSSIEISIHALLAESDFSCASERPIARIKISIHALLAESDTIHTSDIPANLISIHALLAESDLFVCYMIQLL